MPFEKQFIDILLAVPFGYNENMILDYNLLEKHSPTRMYADFIKKNVSNPERIEKIEQFELFLLAHQDANAWACLHEGKYVMCIHLSLFKVVEKRVRDKLQTLPEESKAIFSKCQFTKEEPADYLIYQFATIFTFYHEFAHLLQFKRQERNISHFEKYNLVKGAKFDKLAHAMEIDADVFAAEHMNAHVFQYWNSLPDERRTKEALEVLMSLCILSIFILFFELSEGWRQWYTLDYDHPNSLIRVCYIHDVLYQTSKSNEKKIEFEIDSKVILDNALVMANYFLANEEQSGLESFINIFSNNSTEIHKYIDREMFPYMDSIQFLNYNNRT